MSKLASGVEGEKVKGTGRRKECLRCVHFRTVLEGYEENFCSKGWRYGAASCPYFEAEKSEP
ncbi:MAG: hypothetical protein QXD44_08595 [Candidatus Nezhaarchaeales archaeon]